MTEQITTREATPSFIEGVVVASNSDQSKTVDLSTGVIRLQYWESILQDGIRATVMYGDRNVRYAGPVMWNEIPHRIRLCDSLDTFKSELKTLLFKEAFKC